MNPDLFLFFSLIVLSEAGDPYTRVLIAAVSSDEPQKYPSADDLTYFKEPSSNKAVRAFLDSTFTGLDECKYYIDSIDIHGSSSTEIVDLRPNRGSIKEDNGQEPSDVNHHPV